MIKTIGEFERVIDQQIELLRKCQDEGFLNGIGEDNLEALVEIQWHIPFFRSLTTFANSDEWQGLYEKYYGVKKVMEIKHFLDKHYKTQEG